MLDFDANRTWQGMAERCERASSERHRSILTTVVNHMQSEVRRDLAGLMATLVPEPQYHFWVDGVDIGPKGRAAVEAFYTHLIESGGAMIESPQRRVVVDDERVVHDGISTTLLTGRHAATRGYAVPDVDAHYAVKMTIVAFWTFDENALCVGEDSYTAFAPDAFQLIATEDLPQPYLQYLEEIGESRP